MNIQPVAIMSNKQRNSIETADEDPFLTLSESPSSNLYAIDSKDRITGDLSTFVVDMGIPLMKGRYITLKRVIVPKIPNVNQSNKNVIIRTEFGGGTIVNFDLPVGFYSPVSLANQLVASINAAYALAGVVDTVTCTYSTVTRTFTLSSVNVINFNFSESCDFILYGSLLTGFSGVDISVPTLGAVIRSAMAGMLYTKYITISSNELTAFSFGNSILSSSTQPPNILGLIDLTQMYSDSDFSPTTTYSPLYRSVDVSCGSRLKIVNPTRSINSKVSIEIRDMYGKSVDQVFQLDAPYPENDGSIVMLFQVDY